MPIVSAGTKSSISDAKQHSRPPTRHENRKWRYRNKQGRFGRFIQAIREIRKANQATQQPGQCRLPQAHPDQRLRQQQHVRAISKQVRPILIASLGLFE